MKKNLNIQPRFFPIKGGQGTHIFNIYRELLAQKFKDFLIFSPLVNNLEKHVTIFPETNNSKLKNLGMSFKLLFQFNDIINRCNLGLIHLHGGPGGLFIFRRYNLPIIFTCHHTYWQQSNYVKGQKWKVILYYFEKLSYHMADKIICVSEDTKNILETRYLIDSSKLIYIPNGINLEEFKHSLDPKKEENSLVYVGRLDERKGITFLVETMELIVNENKNIILYVVGEGHLRKQLEVFTNMNKLENNVIFCGKLQDADFKNRIQKSEIMITPSVFEGFGISILEGMALNVPVIGTNVDGIRTIIKNGENGILIDYGNKTELKSAVLKLLNDKNLQGRIIQKAYNDLGEKYNWNRITKSLLKVYAKN